MTRRIVCGIVCGLMLFFGALSVSASATKTVYVFSKDNNGYLMQQQAGELAFWEAPAVLTGQMRTDGKLVLQNNTDCTVDFSLASVSLPYDNAEALTYLDAVTLVIEQEGKEIYHNSFTRLMDADREAIVISNVAPGESRELTMTVSCAYTYTGSLPSYESLVWTFEPAIQARPSVPNAVLEQPDSTLDWVMIAKFAAFALGIIALTCAIVAVLRLMRNRQRKF